MACTVTDKHTSCPCPHAQLDGTGGDNGVLNVFVEDMADKLQVCARPGTRCVSQVG